MERGQGWGQAVSVKPRKVKTQSRVHRALWLRSLEWDFLSERFCGALERWREGAGKWLPLWQSQEQTHSLCLGCACNASCDLWPGFRGNGVRVMKIGCSDGQNTHPALVRTFPVPRPGNKTFCAMVESPPSAAMTRWAGGLALGRLMAKQSPRRAEPGPHRCTHISLVPQDNPRALPGCPWMLGLSSSCWGAVASAFHVAKKR